MHTIGVMIERFRTHARRMHEGIGTYLKEHDDISLRLLEFSDIGDRKALAACDGFIARILDGRMAAALRRTGKPVVDVYCGQSYAGILRVDENRRRVGILAARHFLEHRFTRFAFCGLDGIAFSDGRRDAFADCLRRHHFDCIRYRTPARASRGFEKAVLRSDRVGAAPDRAALATWLKRLPKPIAVFCAHDSRAYQLLQVCAACGIAVPREVAVLGVDDDELLCGYAAPPLSSINHNGVGIGYAAAKALHEWLVNPDRIPTPVEVRPLGLTTRESSNVYSLDPIWLSDALVFIRANVNRNISAADIYRTLGKSHTTVDRAFRAVLGTTVQQSIIRTRLDEARRLLQDTSLPLSEIVTRAGFGNPQRLCHAIRDAFGRSPTALRATSRKVTR